MLIFFRWTMIYFLISTSIMIVVRDEFFFVTSNAFLRSAKLLRHGIDMFPLLLLMLALSWYLSHSFAEFRRRGRNALLVALTCCILLASFSAIKTSMHLIIHELGGLHFFADPFLADLDKALHFGVDPWRLTHAVTQFLGLDTFAVQASVLYGKWWAIPAFYLPAIMVLFGESRKTFLHYVALYLFSWIVLGNIVALIGSSAGPVYFDRAIGGYRFAELKLAMLAGGLQGSWIGDVQDFLWVSYLSKSQSIGSGISAFPSLHLATTTVAALYACEKSRWLGCLGWAFVGAILFTSVWTGYHYAIDGYFSIAVVVALHVYLRKREARSSEQPRVDEIVDTGLDQETFVPAE